MSYKTARRQELSPLPDELDLKKKKTQYFVLKLVHCKKQRIVVDTEIERIEKIKNCAKNTTKIKKELPKKLFISSIHYKRKSENLAFNMKCGFF